ncbi:MAG: Cell division protein FtsZ [Gammaproteobacteria bacterium]|nr:Cell division protein FtsZ [Gammaproteobacteria bacterium]
MPQYERKKQHPADFSGETESTQADNRPIFELVDTMGQQAQIKVIGVGGGGGNAVDHMLEAQIEGVEFIGSNTDVQTLNRSKANVLLQIGNNLTKGLGAGSSPDVGRQAAMEDRDRIGEALAGADMVFITAGMGGGTGTGAAPVVAQVAREQGALAVAVVTRPFPFEGNKRMRVADNGIRELSEHVDSLITIPNERVLEVMGKQATLLDAFARANEVLLNAVQGISELITRPGLINVDFADVRTVMSEMGIAMMGSATASGVDRAVEAARNAVFSPLLEDTNIAGAKGLLVNVTAGMDMAIGEFEEVGNVVREFTSDDATLVIGTVLDPEMKDDLRVTMVATGIVGETEKRQEQPRRVVQSMPKAVNYEEFDAPTVIRHRRESEDMPSPSDDKGLEYLDIPAFLRKQAD